MPGTSWVGGVKGANGAGSAAGANGAESAASTDGAARVGSANGAGKAGSPNGVAGAVRGARRAAPRSTRPVDLRMRPTTGHGPVGTVVVDPHPLFRAGAKTALANHGIAVLGEATQVPEGIELARRRHTRVVLLGDVTVNEAVEAATSLPSCAVVVLLAHASRPELVELLSAGVAGLALRSLTPDDLVATVEAVARGERSVEPVFVPLLAGFSSPETVAAVEPGASSEARLTSKEQLVLAHLARGASNHQIAEALYVTQATVKTHLAHIYTKLGAAGRHEALSRALEMGVLH